MLMWNKVKGGVRARRLDESPAEGADAMFGLNPDPLLRHHRSDLHQLVRRRHVVVELGRVRGVPD